jgi:hypothetical protein
MVLPSASPLSFCHSLACCFVMRARISWYRILLELQVLHVLLGPPFMSSTVLSLFFFLPLLSELQLWQIGTFVLHLFSLFTLYFLSFLLRRSSLSARAGAAFWMFDSGSGVVLCFIPCAFIFIYSHVSASSTFFLLFVPYSFAAEYHRPFSLHSTPFLIPLHPSPYSVSQPLCQTLSASLVTRTSSRLRFPYTPATHPHLLIYA